MARISLVSKSLGPEVIALARALSAQQNEVCILSQKYDFTPDNVRISYSTPFKNWSVREALRLLPRLFSPPTDVLHFVFLKPEDQPGLMHWVLAQLFQAIPGRVVACSFFYSPQTMKASHLREFLRLCHVVTFGAHGHLLEVKRRLPQLKNQVVEVVPPLSELPDINSKNQSQDLQRLLKSLGKFVIVPDNPDQFFVRAKAKEFFFSEPLEFLFLSPRAKNQRANLDYFHLENPTPQEMLLALQNSIGVLTAFSELSLIELQQFQHWTSLTHKALLVRPTQNQLIPGLVLEAKTGWVLSDGEKSLRDILLHYPCLKLPRKLDEDPKFNLIDQASNTLNRMYFKAIALRS